MTRLKGSTDEEYINQIAEALDCHPAYILEEIEQLQNWLAEAEERIRDLEREVEDCEDINSDLREEARNAAYERDI